jgi:hypothetical protein
MDGRVSVAQAQAAPGAQPAAPALEQPGKAAPTGTKPPRTRGGRARRPAQRDGQANGQTPPKQQTNGEAKQQQPAPQARKQTPARKQPQPRTPSPRRSRQEKPQTDEQPKTPLKTLAKTRAEAAPKTRPDTPPEPRPEPRPVGRIGQVASVHVFPLKSAAAPPAGSITVQAAGAIGDRWYAVVDAVTGATLTAEDAPELRSVSALLAIDGAPVLEIAGAPGSLRGERADTALSVLLRRPVRIVPLPRDASRLEAPVHLVTRRSVEAARRGEHAVADCACSVEEPRANLVLDLEVDERGLVGRRVRVGRSVLNIARTPQHCLGVYAEVETPGAIAPGDVVEALP